MIFYKKILKKNLDQEIYLVKLRNKKNKVIKLIKNTRKKKRKDKEIRIFSYIKRYEPKYFSYNKIKKIKLKTLNNIYSEKFIVGESLYSFFDKYKLWKEVSKELVEFLYILSNIPITKQGLSYLNIDSKFNWNTYLNNNFNKFIETIKKEKSLEEELIIKIIEYWNEKKYILKKMRKLTLIHNDLNQENILLELIGNKKIRCKVIDFEWCMLGDPVKDLSKLIWTFNKYPVFRENFFLFYTKKFKNLKNLKQKLEIYWIYDMLNHISQEKYLLQFENWEIYLSEEKRLIRDFFKDK